MAQGAREADGAELPVMDQPDMALSRRFAPLSAAGVPCPLRQRLVHSNSRITTF
jgi:hypothetical protein